MVVAPRGGALAYAGFRWFFAAIIFHSLGFWVAEVAQRWLVHELTESSFYVGLIGFAGNLPILLFSLPGGVLADRVNRVKLIATLRSFGGILTLLLAVLTLSGVIQVWHVVLYALVIGTMFSIEVPSRQSLFPSLVPRGELMHAVAITSAVWSASTVIGPALAGQVITHIGIPGCFFATFGLHALAVFSFVQVGRFARAPESEGEHVWGAFLSGLVYIRDHGAILGLLVLAALTVVFGQSSMFALLPSFAAGTLQGDASTFGLLVTATGIGGLLANIALSTRPDLGRKGRWALGMGVALSLSLLGLAGVDSLPWAVVVLFAIGGLMSGVMTLISTLIQAHVSEGMRGRVMAAFTLAWGTSSFGSLAFGGLGSALGIGVTLALGGVLTLVAVVLVAAVIPTIAGLE